MIYASKVGDTYTTDQGDIWDIIALRCYGDEHAVSTIIEANYDYRFQDAFPANVKLNVPGKAKLGIDLKIRTEIPDLKRLLPWR